MDLLRGYSVSVVLLLLLVLNVATSAADEKGPPCAAMMAARECRRALVSTDSGTITAVDVHDGYRGPYHLQFITLEPSSLFLPVLLHTDMAFYVHTGRGTITYISKEDDEDDEPDQIDVMRGDVYRLEQGTIFYMQSHAEPMREKLRIHAIFSTADIMNPMEVLFGVYSNISDLVRGFDSRVLQMGFQVSEETIQEIKSSPSSPSIVPLIQKNEMEADVTKSRWEEGELDALFGFFRGPNDAASKNKKKKSKSRKAFNFFDHKPDVQNANGWSIAVTHKDLKALKDSNFGAFMVNLTRGSMMGPHWNPRASEVAVVIQGQGMVQVVCPSNPSGATSKCRQRKFKVREGDVFVVPRYYAMAQVSYNNETFVFAGFSSMSGKNHPQFLSGKRSVLQTVDKDVLSASFKTRNATIVSDLLASQEESIILACTSCAEELERKMEEEIEKQRQEEEEAKRREEEEARKRQEEEEAKRREEEEARKREEEEEAKSREEEEARKREEEEEAKRREEEARKREEEEEAKRREEEEARKREEEEEARRREEQEEEARRREEEEARRREKEEARRREKEAAKRREKEEARRRQKEEEARRREKEEAAKRREKEEARRRQKEEEARRREKEEGAARRRQEEEETQEEEREEEEARRRQKKEEGRRQQEEEEATRREEEATREAEEEEARRREQEEEEEEGGGRRGEGEEEEYEPARREREEAARGRGDEEADWILQLQQQQHQQQLLLDLEEEEIDEEKLMEMARRLDTEADAERW